MNTPTLHHLLAALNQWAPPALAEGYDNVGLLVGDAHQPCRGALVALELTEAVLDEALAHHCNLVLCHHPIWFGKRLKLTTADWQGRLMLRAIREGVALAAWHTNLDHVPHGVNALIGEKLGCTAMRILAPQPEQLLEQSGSVTVGAGMIGALPRPMSPLEFLEHMGRVFGTPVVRYAPAPAVPHIREIAWCGGAGSFLLPDALRAGVQAFVTGDVTHHKFFDAEGQLWYCDVGHWESEQYTPELFVRFLSEKFPNFAARQSSVNTNPVLYYRNQSLAEYTSTH
jgi:dinuclear metal center YbgI/SA1388 family protein